MLLLFLSIFVFSMAHAVNPVTLYSIDAQTRASQIVAMIDTLNKAPYLIRNRSEVALQANLVPSPAYANYIRGGFIPYVQNATTATNETLLLITYLPTGSTSNTQYVVVPVEQTVSLMYSPQPINPTTGISSNYPQSALPRFSVNLAHRAADLRYMFNLLNTNSTYKTRRSQVGIQITLAGPYYPQLRGNLIPNVQSITLVSPNDTLLLIDYQNPPASGRATVTGSIVVAAEQIDQMIYFPTGM